MASFSDVPGIISPGHAEGFSSLVLWPSSVASQLSCSAAVQPSRQAANLASWASFGNIPQYWPPQVPITLLSLGFSGVSSHSSQVLPPSIVWNLPSPPPPPPPYSEPGSISGEIVDPVADSSSSSEEDSVAPGRSNVSVALSASLSAPLSAPSFVSVAPSAGLGSSTGWSPPFSQGSHLHSADPSTVPPIPNVWAPGTPPSFSVAPPPPVSSSMPSLRIVLHVAPVPGRLVAKIVAGSFVDMSELLPATLARDLDSAYLPPPVSSASNDSNCLKRPQIRNLQDWIEGWASYTAVSSHCFIFT